MKMRDVPRSAEPITFNGHFGWLHMPPGAQYRRCGVVLCNPFTAAPVQTHRNWRHLADLIAAAGFPVLRFDYPCTGDSADVPADELLDAWLRSIADAAGWLRGHVAIDELALCGLRFGALLAAAAQAAQADHLALLAPATCGRMYARELKIAGQVHGTTQPLCGGLEAEGLYLPVAQVTRLRALDLKHCLRAAPPRRLLVLEGPWQPGIGKQLAEAVPASTEVALEVFSEWEYFYDAAAKTRVPKAAFSAVVAWLEATPAAAPQTANIAAPPPASLALSDGVTSTAFRFGPDGGLFGIAYAPATPLADTPAILLVNCGGEPHTGHARFSVLLCRHLAAHGRTAFTIDVGGLGDSARQPLRPEDPSLTTNERGVVWVYRPELVDDVVEAVDEIERRGISRCVVVGLCSGANLALLTALRDPRVTGVVLINPTFVTREGCPFVPLAAPPVGVRGLIRRGLDAVGFDRRRRDRTRDFWRTRRLHAGAGMARLLNAPALLDQRTRWLWDLRARNVDMLAIANDGDDGIADWHRYAGALGMPPPIVLPGISHTFEPVVMREALINVISAHLTKST
jgi:alpha-beta hydrolase superfamily lysophospholipase